MVEPEVAAARAASNSPSIRLLLGDDPAALQLAVLERCRQALRAEQSRGTAGTVLWIVPNRRAQRHWSRRLATAHAAAILAPPVVTFDQFAERLLQAAGRPATAISSTVRRLLLRRITQQLAESGELRHFKPVAQTSGFLDIVESFIAELKRDEIWPEEFQAATVHGRSRRDVELGQIYERYQQALVTHSWYDPEGRFWLARSELQAGNCRGLPDWSWIGVSGFTDFTFTQSEILEQLAPRCAQLLLTLPHDVAGRRPVLFEKSATACRAIEQLWPQLERETIAPRADESPDRRQIRTSLFGNPREVVPRERATDVELIGCLGAASELASVALRIKAWLRAGVLPGEIAIGLRSVQEEGLRWLEGLRSAGLPVWCDTGPPVAESGLVKFLVAVLQTELEDWTFARLTSVLGSSYLAPGEYPGNWDQDSRAVSQVLRGLRLPQGRVQILDSVSAAHRRLSTAAVESQTAAMPDEDPEEVTIADLPAVVYARADRCLQWYQQVTQRLRQSHPLVNWVDVVSQLLKECGALPHPAAEDQSDRVVWEQWQSLLRESAAAELAYTGAAQKLSPTEFLRELRDLLTGERHDTPPEPIGAIAILGLDQLRHVTTPYLVIAGLTEESFPRRRSDDCLFSDAERRQLAAAGLPIRHASLHQQEEMLFFAQLMLSSERHLLLTYPEVNHRGQPAFASPYVTALQSLWAEHGLPVQHEGQLDPVPTPDRAVLPADARLTAMQAAMQGRAGWLRTLWDEPTQRGMVTSVVAAVEMATRRFHTQGFTEYEGRLEIAANQQTLADRFSISRQFSATELEAYARCPFRFWLQNVLRIEPLPTMDEGTDVQRRGIVVHDVLSELIAEMRQQPERERLTARFHELVAERLEDTVTESDLQRALLRIEQQVLSEWGVAYAEQFLEYAEQVGKVWGGDWQPATPELPFGDVPGVEPDSAPPPLELGTADNPVRIRGRIDRIDTGEIDGQPVFTVIDYKTGKRSNFSSEDVQAGRSLQLVLYAIAARRLNMVPSTATPFQIGYWCLKETGFLTGLKTGRATKTYQAIDATVWESMEEIVEETIPRLAAGMRRGEFVVDNPDDNCTGRCEYRTVCRVQQLRPLADTLQKVRPSE